MEIKKQRLNTNDAKYQDGLSFKLRQHFSQINGFTKIFDDINDINFSHRELTEQVSCYKFELG